MDDPDCEGVDLGPCAANGQCATDCVTRDPDCPPAPIGDPCGGGSDCQSGLCIPAPDEPAISYCTGDCNPSDNDCPNGMDCVPATGGRNVCIYPFPTPGSVGAGCDANTECVSGLCLDGLCSGFCEPGVTECREGFDCSPTTDGRHVCVPGAGFNDEDDKPWYSCAVAAGRPGRRGGLLPMFAAAALLVAFVRRRR
jgi:hypothetical protein